MGWMTLLVDKKNKLMIPVGKSSEEQFMDNLTIFKRVNKKLEEFEEEGIDFYELKDRTLRKITIDDLGKLMKCADIVSDLTAVFDHPMSYYYYLRIAKNPSENCLDENFEIISDYDKNYNGYSKKYKVIEEHEFVDWEKNHENKKIKRKRH